MLIDIVMFMYSLMKYTDDYSKISGSLWQYYRNGPVLENNNDITNFHADNRNSTSFEFKEQITGYTRNGGIKKILK